MAATKFLDYDGLIHLWQQIKSGFVSTSGYVAYTTAEQTKLSGIESGAEVNVIEEITVNGTAVTPSSKSVALTIPTVPTTVSSFTNDAGYLTASDITGISYEIVSSYSDLPLTGATGKIYLVPNSGSSGNIYDEYIWVTSGSGAGATSAYEKIGTTAVDLSHYWKDNGTDNNSLIAMTNSEIEAAIAAANQSA